MDYSPEKRGLGVLPERFLKNHYRYFKTKHIKMASGGQKTYSKGRIFKELTIQFILRDSSKSLEISRKVVDKDLMFNKLSLEISTQSNFIF